MQQHLANLYINIYIFLKSIRNSVRGSGSRFVVHVIISALCPSYTIGVCVPVADITVAQINLTRDMSRAAERLRLIIGHLDRPSVAIVSSLCAA